MNNCIICHDESGCSRAIEHIVPESMGNTEYVLNLGDICDTCNSKFSKFEQKALSGSVIAFERAKLGVKSKKKRSAKGEIQKLKFEGNKDFEPNKVTLFSHERDVLKPSKKGKGLYELTVPSFDKSPVPTSKLLLKIGIESLYKSQKKVYNQYVFDELRSYLMNKTNKDWPFLTNTIEIENGINIPRFSDKHHLRKIKCTLNMKEEEENLIFNLKYGAVSMAINLASRSADWIKNYSDWTIYPSKLRKDAIL